MDVGLVLVFPLLVLVWVVGVFHRSMVVLMGVKCHQVFHLVRVPAPEMMDGMWVLVIVDRGLMLMKSELGRWH